MNYIGRIILQITICILGLMAGIIITSKLGKDKPIVKLVLWWCVILTIAFVEITFWNYFWISEIRDKTGPMGPRGAQGPPGPQGPPGVSK